MLGGVLTWQVQGRVPHSTPAKATRADEPTADVVAAYLFKLSSKHLLPGMCVFA